MLQCPLFKFKNQGFSGSELQHLETFAFNVNKLTVDVSFTLAEQLPASTHYMPFAANFHYVPKLPGRSIRIDSTYLLSATDDSTDGGDHIGQPPTPHTWAPAALLSHQRPILACYVGKNSRKPTTSNKRIMHGWRVKDAVRCNPFFGVVLDTSHGLQLAYS